MGREEEEDVMAAPHVGVSGWVAAAGKEGGDGGTLAVGLERPVDQLQEEQRTL